MMTVIEWFERDDAIPAVWIQFVRKHKPNGRLSLWEQEIAIAAMIQSRTDLPLDSIDDETYRELRDYEYLEFWECWHTQDIDDFARLRKLAGFGDQKKAQRNAFRMWHDKVPDMHTLAMIPSQVVKRIPEGKEPELRELVMKLPDGEEKTALLSSLRGRKAGRSKSKYKSVPLAIIHGWFAHQYALATDRQMIKRLKIITGLETTPVAIDDARRDYELTRWRPKNC